ncbi:alpha/beta fold hydrolase [Nocardia vulneris]|uniref:alpha/beta fold hydrolase n=1 Tax=Nocardia vulneris TaxID=1141657 RepID=UPI003BAEB300
MLVKSMKTLADARNGALTAAYRAGLRSRTFRTASLNTPTAPHEVISVTTVDGARLRVHAYGPADGDVIVLIHGWSCSIEYWNPQINAFADRYRVVCYDQRGHGESQLGKRMPSRETLADDLSAVLDAVLRPGQRAVLAGHSMGGITIRGLGRALPRTGAAPRRRGHPAQHHLRQHPLRHRSAAAAEQAACRAEQADHPARRSGADADHSVRGGAHLAGAAARRPAGQCRPEGARDVQARHRRRGELLAGHRALLSPAHPRQARRGPGRYRRQRCRRAAHRAHHRHRGHLRSPAAGTDVPAYRRRPGPNRPPRRVPQLAHRASRQYRSRRQVQRGPRRRRPAGPPAGRRRGLTPAVLLSRSTAPGSGAPIPGVAMSPSFARRPYC